jgi:transcriptional regulator with XRE-family HTH domain
MPDATLTFAEFLDRRLAELGIRPAELARRVNVTPTAVVNWRHKGGRPNRNLIRPLADALEADPEEIAVLAGHAPAGAPVHGPAVANDEEVELSQRLSDACRQLSLERLSEVVDFAEFLALRDWRDDWQRRALSRIASINEAEPGPGLHG